jgi:hypothetical protein
MKVFTTKKINKLEEDYHSGQLIKRADKYNYQNILYTRKKGLSFVYTNEELFEYTKCANDPQYFIEKYFNIKLKDYQKEILTEFKNNRFSILASSRQSGINLLMKLIFLHYTTFNLDKKIHILANKLNHEFIDDIKFYYCKLPFFLKQGIIAWNKYTLCFENGSTIKMISNIYAIGNTTDLLYIKDFVYIKNIEKQYAAIIPEIISLDDSKIIIKSIFKDNKFFKDLVYKSELPNDNPEKNLYKTHRVYWWQYMSLDEKEKIISRIGEELFKIEYDLQSKNK